MNVPRLGLILCCLVGVGCNAGADEPESAVAGTSGAQTSGADASGDSTTAPVGTDGTEGPAESTSSTTMGDLPTSTAGGETSSTTDAPDGDSSSGTESTGPALPRGQWAITEITYTEGGMSETLTMQDRAFCDATLDGGVLLLRYQQQGGFTVWALYMPEATGVGSHPLTQDFSGVYMNINEVSNAWQAYFDPSMAFGNLELTDADLQPGGTVAGTLTATLTSNDGTTTAEFESTFYAEIPL